MRRRTRRKPRGERDEEVEALLLADLTHDDPRGAHPQRLLDQPAQLDLASAFEAGLTALHGGDVGQRHLEHEQAVMSQVIAPTARPFYCRCSIDAGEASRHGE